MDDNLDWLGKAKGDTRIAKFRDLATRHAAGIIEDDAIDCQTAALVIEIHDKLSEAHQAQFVSYSPHKMGMLAWKLYGKVSVA